MHQVVSAVAVFLQQHARDVDTLQSLAGAAAAACHSEPPSSLPSLPSLSCRLIAHSLSAAAAPWLTGGGVKAASSSTPRAADAASERQMLKEQVCLPSECWFFERIAG